MGCGSALGGLVKGASPCDMAAKEQYLGKPDSHTPRVLGPGTRPGSGSAPWLAGVSLSHPEFLAPGVK